jgi:hypothetical protein
MRCPEGDRHIYDGDGKVCKKCSYSNAKAIDFDESYYEKYHATFIEYLTAENDVVQTTGRRLRSDDEYIAKAAQILLTRGWTFNFDLIIKINTIFKLDRHILQALGAHEGLSIDQINDESFVARIPKTRIDIRIQSLRECLRDIIIIYNVVKRIPSHEKISYKSITLFIEEYWKKLAIELQQKINTSPITLEECINNMPSIGKLIIYAFEINDIDELNKTSDDLFPSILALMLDLFIAERKAAEIVDFHIETICRFILAIYEIGTPCAILLSKQIVARIVEHENMMLKSDHYNLSVVEGTKLASDDFDMAMSDNIINETYEGEDQQNGDEEDETVFSLDAFDVDDARGDDDIIVDDDDQPLIHVGEEAGW